MVDNSENQRKIGLFLAILFFAIAGFLFFSHKKAYADTLTCECYTGKMSNVTERISVTVGSSLSPTSSETSQCNDTCKSKSYDGGTLATNSVSTLSQIKSTVNSYSPTNLAAQAASNLFSAGVKIVLSWVLTVAGWFLSAAATLFSFVVDTKNLDIMLNSTAVYESWEIIRDLLNMTFIIILLFSAFATIFQVSSYNYKAVVFNLVLMALLVNFSFPIARFIIDASNVLMYTIINTLFSGDASNTLGDITKTSGIETILNPTLSEVSATSLIAAIIFIFIFAVTLVTTALLLMVRMIALGILIIFSPVAFVGTILPGGKSFSSKWWSNLFNYSLFGPAMLLMLWITKEIMDEFFKDNNVYNNFYTSAQNQSAQPNLIGSMAYFSIPIILLWASMGIAKKMGIEGADKIVGGGQKFLKWMGNKSNPYGWTKWGLKTSGISGGVKKGLEGVKKSGKIFGKKIPLYAGTDAIEARENKYAGFIKGGSSGYKKAAKNLFEKKVNEKLKEMEEVNTSVADAINKLTNGDQIEKKAAVKYLNKKKAIGDTSTAISALNIASGDKDLQYEIFNSLPKNITDGIIKDHDDLDRVFMSVGRDADMVKEIIGKIKADNNLKILIDYDINKGKIDDKTGNIGAKSAPDTAYTERLSKLNAQKFADQKGLDPSTNADLKAYIQTNIANSANRRDWIKYYGELNTANKIKWQAAGLKP